MGKSESNLNKEHESFATFKRIVRYDEMIASGTKLRYLVNTKFSQV